MARTAEINDAGRDRLEIAGQIGSRLRGETRSLLESLPPERRKAAELVRWLRLQPALVYRVVAGAKHAGDPVGVLLAVPGVEGFRMFVAAASKRGVNPARVRALATAVDAYARFIDDLGGSQSQLRAAIQTLHERHSNPQPPTPGPLGAGDDDAALARLALARALGRSAAATVAVQLYLPSDDDPGYIEAWTVSGKAGLAGPRSSLPIRFATAVVGGDEASRPVRHESGLLEEFCSPSLKRTDADPAGASRVEIVEPPDGVTACDVFSAPRRTPRVAKLPPDDNDGVLNCGLVVNIPSAWLVYDVYIHRSLAARSVPELGVFAASPIGLLSGHPSKRWFDRIPDAASLQLLARESASARTPAYTRHEELTACLFRRANLDPAHFVGHRCAVPNPYWGASYVITFDFGGLSET